MKLSREDFNWAASTGLISDDQAQALWQAFEQRGACRPSFVFAHVAYYTGALIVIGAMGWFMTLGWERFGGGGLFLIASLYAAAFALAGRRLWDQGAFPIPGGLLMTMAVCMTPLAVYGLERMLGLWPQGDPGTYRSYHIWVKGSWFAMEIATILAALAALRVVRFPFLTAPIAFTLWYMSMDLTPLLFGQKEFTWDERLWVSVWFGMAILVGTYLVDRKTKEDYAYWLYLFGLLAFWGGLSAMRSDSEWNKFAYCLINVALMGCSIFFARPVFITFGGMGVFGYLGHLANTIFKDSMLFPFALSGLGLAIIYLGIAYQRHRDFIEQALLQQLPEWLRRLRPQAER
jgi:hypothetical protein